MRKSIYKGELFEIEQKINDKTIFSVIENKLFQSTIKDRGDKKFYIRDSIKSIDDLEAVLKGIGNIDNHIDKLKSIFEFNDDLKIPEGLKDAILEENVVLFIGAGVSKSLGYPTWVEFANNAINELLKNGYINHNEKEDLLNIKDPKELLTLFDKICPRTEECSKSFYEGTFKFKSDDLSTFSESMQDNLYYLLTNEVFGWKYITTNIDKEIIRAKAYHRYLKEKSLLKESEKDLEERDKGDKTEVSFTQLLTEESKKIVSSKPSVADLNNNIIFLHGIVDKVEDTIFTTKDYLRTYFRQGSPEQKFLQKIFSENTILFIGYGLSEFSILESIVNGSDNTHYSLYSTFYNYTSTLKTKQKAFSDLNIELVPYYLDYDGFKRLPKVIKSWSKEIEDYRGRDFIDNRNLLDEIL